MAIFTFSLREMCETFGRDEVKSWFMDYELSDYLSQEEIDSIVSRGTWSKERLADKIIDHYYMHESGQETPALFKHYAKVAMQEIMEQKLPIIYSVSIQYDPTANMNVVESYRGTNDTNTENSGDGTTRNSDTPQGNVQKADILSGKYVSSTSGNEYTGKGRSNQAQEYVKTKKGNAGMSAQVMLKQYRENIVMIDRDIINDLASIFHGVLV